MKIPVGWKLVPIDPTPEMLVAMAAAPHSAMRYGNSANKYHAALKFAPEAPNERKRYGGPRVCETCKKTFINRDKNHGVGRFCSYPCATEARRRKRACVQCGQMHQKRTKTCGPICDGLQRSTKQKGDKSHRWEGGKTSEAMLIRTSAAYAEWRSAVFARDNYICQICGDRGGKLHADHILPFSTHPDKRLDVDNGRTLCQQCHFKTDTWGGRARPVRGRDAR